MKISPVLMALASFGEAGITVAQVEKLDGVRGKHPQNRLYQMNKLLNQYTIMLRGFAIPSDGDISDIVNSRKLGKALSRNNKWLNGMLNTFWSVKPNGTPRECSKYFQDVERKRRSDRLVIDILNDEETFAYECDLKYEDHLDAVDAGEESGECTDCCARGENGQWIATGAASRSRAVNEPDNMAKAIRRVVGGVKKWGKKYISECGGQQQISSGKRTPHYNLLIKRLKPGLRHRENLESEILGLRWKRVFPASYRNLETGKMVHHKHEQFYADLGISQD